MNRQASLDILQYNRQEAQKHSDKKKQEKVRQMEEERQYIERIHSEMHQERNSKILKKQAIVNQTQRDYVSYLNNKQTEVIPSQGQSLRKRNSKLMELNTFKIGGETREIKRKNYQDYNDNLTLNPTKNNPMLKNTEINNIYNTERRAQPLKAFNIISNEMNKEFNENPINYTSNEYKQAVNKENFDQYGRQIGVKPIETDMKAQYDNVKGIENLENFSAYNDHYNYRPSSEKSNRGSNNQYSQQGYVQEKGRREKQEQPQQYSTQSYSNQPPQNYSLQPSNKVDLNTIPIPENIKTVEEYEQYLISIGIDPLTLEYIDNKQQPQEIDNNLYEKMNNLNINTYQQEYPQINQPTKQINNKNQIFYQESSKEQEQPKKEYVPIVRNKNGVMSNPCKLL